MDCAAFLDEIRALGRNSTPLKLEQILTRARLPMIRQHVKPKTLIYTYYIEGIDRLLRDALMEDGWKVGFYTGDDKTGKDAFIKGDLDVLIATAAIGTGVDGLQHVCNRLIVNVLPWTRAEYDQLLGRIYRQGQMSKEEVAVILPLTFAIVNGQRWSWCESKMQRLAFKKSIADAAVDGVVPEGHLRSPAQAFQDVMAWLERLESGEVEVITRPRIVVPLPDTDPNRREAAPAPLRRLLRDEPHLEPGPERSNPRTPAGQPGGVGPVPHALPRGPQGLGGCTVRGDDPLVQAAERLRHRRFRLRRGQAGRSGGDRHTVHSFDHVAINDNVVACDMAHVPLDDETLDVAIFSLSLMGANFADYLRRRTARSSSMATCTSSRRLRAFPTVMGLSKALEGLGFAVVSVEDKWKFTHIRALKTEPPGDGIEMRF